MILQIMILEMFATALLAVDGNKIKAMQFMLSCKELKHMDFIDVYNFVENFYNLKND